MQIGAFEAKNTLESLLGRVERGEEIIIIRGGKPVARLAPISPERSPSASRFTWPISTASLSYEPRTRVDVAALRAITEGMAPATESAGAFTRRMRDEDRY